MTDPRFSRVPVSRFEGQKGPNGRLLCRECGTETKPPKRFYCSPECTEAWDARWPSRQRVHVEKRDKGVCALCGLDCLKLERELNELGALISCGGTAAVAALNKFRILIAQHSIPRHKHGFHYVRSLWEMDHVIPVVEGGGELGLENLRILCWACHRLETAKLAKRRAEQRKGAAQ